MSSTQSCVWYALVKYGNQTKKIHMESCNKSYKTLVKCIRVTFSIDEKQAFSIEIYDKTKNKYFNIEKYKFNQIAEGKLIRVVDTIEAKQKNMKLPASHAIKPSNVKPYFETHKRNKWKVNSKIEIYSETQHKWQKGQIINIYKDPEGEWLIVKYGGFSTKEIQRFSNYVRPMQKHKPKKKASKKTTTVKNQQKELKSASQNVIGDEEKIDSQSNFLSLKKKIERKQFMEQTRNKIIHAAKNESFMLLLLMKTISNRDVTAEKDLNDAHFTIVLDFEYKEWMSNCKKYEEIFKLNICQAITGVKPSMIEIEEVTAGSSRILWKIKNFPLIIKQLKMIFKSEPEYKQIEDVPPAPASTAKYEMQLQDQIEVKYQNDWFSATIIEISSQTGTAGKYFQVRYNPFKGENIFLWNTEWLHTRKEAARLRFPGQLIKTEHGDEVWNPPGIAMDKQGIRANNVNELKMGHHIFVKYKDYWWRCEIVDRKKKIFSEFQNCEIDVSSHYEIEVMGLNYGASSKLTLHLWKKEDVDLISLKDMRDQN